MSLKRKAAIAGVFEHPTRFAPDKSMFQLQAEAARGALFGAGHGTPGGDLRFADPQSRCEPTGESGYRFRHPAVLSSLTPAWDWVAVHAVTGTARPDAVLAFAGRGSRCTPAFRVARVQGVAVGHADGSMLGCRHRS